MTASADLPRGDGRFRADECAVRLLFVKHSRDYAELVCETLETTHKGRFEVRHADRLDAARHHVEAGDFDAVLVDLPEAADPDRRRVHIDEASTLASRVPVIVLTGHETEDESAAPASESLVRDRIARSRLPDEILKAVRRHRRLGPSGSREPIVLRDPLRACARIFARLRRSLSAR